MISNIIDWAIARKFHEYCTLEKEFEKTKEETKEILEAIKNNDLEIKLSNNKAISIKLSDEQKQKEIEEIKKLIDFSTKEIEFNKKFLDNKAFLEKANEKTILDKKNKLQQHETNLKFYQELLIKKQTPKK